MEKDTEVTNVQFYIATYPGYEGDEQPRKEVLAVFTEQPEDDGECYYCYTHIGQHSICSQSFLAESCRKASQEEYQELFNELENLVGYNLKVI
jgi:hypothetical protein